MKKRQAYPTVRPATKADMEAIARTNAMVFMGNRDRPDVASLWVNDLFKARRTHHYFVIEIGKVFAGFIMWRLEGGFLRSEPVIELDQLGIVPKFSGNGLGRKIIEMTREEMMQKILGIDNRIESHVSFIVWGYSDNYPALRLYSTIFQERMGTRRMHGDREETGFRLRVRVLRQLKK